MMAQMNKGSFERCCRLCAEEQDVTIMIFSAEAEAMLLQNKLNKYLLLEVDEDDKLPKNICLKCCSKLQTVCDFIDTAHRAQELLTNRCIRLDEAVDNNSTITPKLENPPETVELDDDAKFTEMEVSVDPMMVLQNSEEDLSPESYDNTTSVEDVTHLHSVDGENVTIKLIKKCEASPDSNDEKNLMAKPFPCMTCKRSFFTELALRNHSWIHTGDSKDKKYKCNIGCVDVFDYKCDLVTHLKSQHKTNGMCQLCGRMFRSEKTYNAHMAVHASSGKSFTCKICGRSYKTWGSLRTHNITHSSERPYHCPFCKKSFKRNQDLKFHINQHTGAKPYKCPFCEKSFASSGNCYSHRSRMHPGHHVEGKIKRWNGAPKENQILPTRMANKSHITNVKGIYKYQCQICDHSFLRRDNYTYHMYQHTGEKPFQCSLCPDKFVTRKGLLIHHDKIHPTQDRPLALLSKNVLLK